MGSSGDAPIPGFADAYTSHLDYTALRTGERTASAWVPLRPDLARPDGKMRAGVVSFLTDATAGVVCGMAAVPNWIVTADLQVRFLGLPTVGPARADAIVRRPGRRQSCGEVTVVDEGDGDRVVAVGTVNHLAIQPETPLEVPADMPVGVLYGRAVPADGASQPLAELLGLQVGPEGSVEVPIAGIAVNPLGFLHGGIIGLLAEECARAHGASVRDMVLRFVGPVVADRARAVPRIVRDGSGRILQIDVTDATGRIGTIVSLGLDEEAP